MKHGKDLNQCPFFWNGSICVNLETVSFLLHIRSFRNHIFFPHLSKINSNFCLDVKFVFSIGSNRYWIRKGIVLNASSVNIILPGIYMGK